MWAAAYLVKEAAGLARLGRLARAMNRKSTKYTDASKTYRDAVGYDAQGHIPMGKYTERQALPEVVAAKQQMDAAGAQLSEKDQATRPVAQGILQRLFHRAAMASPEKAKRMVGGAFETISPIAAPAGAAKMDQLKNSLFGGQKLDTYTPLLQGMYRKSLASGSRTPIQDFGKDVGPRLQAGVASGQIDPAGIADMWSMRF